MLFKSSSLISKHIGRMLDVSIILDLLPYKGITIAVYVVVVLFCCCCFFHATYFTGFIIYSVLAVVVFI